VDLKTVQNLVKTFDVLFLLQPTNAQLYITTASLYIIYTAACFDISMSSSGCFTFMPCSVTEILKIEVVKIKI
jgi:cytochrome c oxidase assembly factor CtaG